MTEQELKLIGMIGFDEFMHRLTIKVATGLSLKDALIFHSQGKDKELKDSSDYKTLLALIKTNSDGFAHRYLDDLLSLAYFTNTRNLNN